MISLLICSPGNQSLNYTALDCWKQKKKKKKINLMTDSSWKTSSLWSIIQWHNESCGEKSWGRNQSWDFTPFLIGRIMSAAFFICTLLSPVCRNTVWNNGNYPLAPWWQRRLFLMPKKIKYNDVTLGLTLGNEALITIKLTARYIL